MKKILLWSILLTTVVSLPSYFASATPDYGTAQYQELSAKIYLLKHQPGGYAGMPQLLDTKKQALELIKNKNVSRTWAKQNQEMAKFIRRYVNAKSDTALYKIVQQLNAIHLTKTDNGYTYEFQHGAGCTIQKYSGSLILNGNIVTDDTMEMHSTPTPC